MRAESSINFIGLFFSEELEMRRKNLKGNETKRKMKFVTPYFFPNRNKNTHNGNGRKVWFTMDNETEGLFLLND